ncbi:MAG: cbb3-type cytochrome oxidase assembly protein CcoS [Candidatus Accumulibacter sp.]|jgi:cbb3-type cytochrome oxidase maturation protein|uniref:cbb3-type cytochrome oxidase assembly protein CcoS n=1 Tax=unclassified Candidatus Accumulibacter TaxID=2619054 RepID=UPI0012CD294A|nr:MULTISPECIES: cbb3-type cytochrome oxidase assembly protein CcoS [unclassified Candidatus Accumulibacter]MBL8367692.1 cbb3-type cytochrome oxidase assembly protein CcoS [Accumulibacter sp.]MBN8513742.1 cbb3-type cytochrome oxidase assembly protein CcoS [Accumulibacter sp.]MBO3702269.1 cbb3-type cytochrome oxidase assembly protein CcoS [Accumulibacter sp.]MQM33160.1 cbb3-type cytochrome oxidase assembly protein CcoS [Candidatus Accumulibacter phosphatis]
METLYLLIPISVVLVFLIAIAFWWSLRNGQFDDLEGPAYRILMDDDKATRPVASDPDSSPGDAGRAPSREKSSAANLHHS